MVSKFFPNLKNSERGITLIEIVIAIFIMVVLSLILIADFPKMQRQFALSRVSYKLEQDLRMAIDCAMSGVQICGGQKLPLHPALVKGYGIFITQNTTKYIIYADVADKITGEWSKTFDNTDPNPKSCDRYDSVEDSGDCIVATIDISKENRSLYIKGFNNISDNHTSINFSPPDPIVNIDKMGLSGPTVGIILGLYADDLATRTVQVTTSGLISVH